MTIPFFIYLNNKWHPGEISRVAGAGASSVFYVMVNNYYWGRLREYQDKCVFDASPTVTEDFAAHFQFLKS